MTIKKGNERLQIVLTEKMLRDLAKAGYSDRKDVRQFFLFCVAEKLENLKAGNGRK